MKVQFANPDLDRLETDISFDANLPREAVKGYRKVMGWIRGAKDERDFFAMRSLNFEKLKGDRKGQWSMRLNNQWRLILEIEEAQDGNILVLISIEDYH